MRDVESDFGAIPETIDIRPGGLEYRDLDACDEMPIHAACQGVLAKPEQTDRGIFDVGLPSGAIDGDPDGGGHLQGQFMKLEGGYKADHSPRYAGRGFGKAASGIRNRVGAPIEAARHNTLANQPGNGLDSHASVAKIAYADQYPLATEIQDDVTLFRQDK